MMNSLFSTFDPITYKFQLNWMMMMTPMIMYPMNFWISKSRTHMMKYKLKIN